VATLEDLLRGELVKCKVLPVEQRREDFTNRLKDFLIGHPGDILECSRIFPESMEKWRETLIRVLGQIQRVDRIPDHEVSVNSDYSKFRLLKISRSKKPILIEVEFSS
jgi:hypothetical protein